MEDNNKELWDLVNRQETVVQKKKMARALGLEFKHPSINEQVSGNSKVVGDFKRGRARHGRQMILIPPVTMQTRVIPSISVEPCCAREVAAELIRVADKNGW